MPLPKRINLKDIASSIGVSVGSVSSVLNNRQLERRIPPDTAKTIREAAAKLGYLPNINARRLRSGAEAKSTIIIALITSFEAPISLTSEYIKAIYLEELKKKSPSQRIFSFTIEMYSAGKLSQLPGLLTGDRFNAAIILNTVPSDDLFLSRNHLPYPTVIVNRTIPGMCCVAEATQSGTLPAEILVKQKRLKAAILFGKPLTQATQNRLDSFCRKYSALTGNLPTEIISPSLTEMDAYKTFHAFLNEGGQCDGLYTVTDSLALGAYKAIKEKGWNIPKKIAVISTGDSQIGPFLDPPLTSIGESMTELAKITTRLLLKQLANESIVDCIYSPIVKNLRSSTGHD